VDDIWAANLHWFFCESHQPSSVLIYRMPLRALDCLHQSPLPRLAGRGAAAGVIGQDAGRWKRMAGVDTLIVERPAR